MSSKTCFLYAKARREAPDETQAAFYKLINSGLDISRQRREPHSLLNMFDTDGSPVPPEMHELRRIYSQSLIDTNTLNLVSRIILANEASSRALFVLMDEGTLAAVICLKALLKFLSCDSSENNFVIMNRRDIIDPRYWAILAPRRIYPVRFVANRLEAPTRQCYMSIAEDVIVNRELFDKRWKSVCPLYSEYIISWFKLYLFRSGRCNAANIQDAICSIVPKLTYVQLGFDLKALKVKEDPISVRKCFERLWYNGGYPLLGMCHEVNYDCAAVLLSMFVNCKQDVRELSVGD